MRMMDEQMETEGVIELGEKLVHLDLKGAPPRISYYEKLFPLLHHWGATGVLIEYEDMFPYHGNLSVLTSRNVYSVEDINKIQSIAQQNSLTVIPLVQTFGHLEFVLKHSQYSHLREVPNIPMSLCPLHKESLQLVTSMLDQVIELHPNIQSFHIGADEVFFIAECERCQLHLDQDGISQAQLFLSFVMKVILNLKAKHPKLRIIMWDDMFRDASSEIIKDSGIGELAEPMVWSYEKTLNLPEGIWDKYTENFDGFWLASAFKGATGPCMNVTDIDYHVGNHVSWLKVVREQLLHQKGLQGFCITGWQRYDHYAVLCELIPSSLPCLAVCLRTLVNGNFTADVHQQASEDLDFTGLIPLSPFRSIGLISECKFSGSTIYICIQQHLIIYERAKCFINNDSLCGWMSDYHVKRNFTNPAHLKNLLPQAHQLVQAFQCIQRDLYNPLCEVYYKDVFEEWVAVNITPMLQQLQTIIEKIDTQLALAEVPQDINLLQRQRSSYDNTENS